MSDNPLVDFQHFIIAGLAGIFGVYGGVKVHGSKIDEIIRRLDRLENKVDRIVEREAEDR